MSDIQVLGGEFSSEDFARVCEAWRVARNFVMSIRLRAFGITDELTDDDRTHYERLYDAWEWMPLDPAEMGSTAFPQRRKNRELITFVVAAEAPDFSHIGYVECVQTSDGWRIDTALSRSS